MNETNSTMVDTAVQVSQGVQFDFLQAFSDALNTVAKPILQVSFTKEQVELIMLAASLILLAMKWRAIVDTIKAYGTVLVTILVLAIIAKALRMV